MLTVKVLSANSVLLSFSEGTKLHKQICPCTYQVKQRNDKHSTFTFTFKTIL